MFSTQPWRDPGCNWWRKEVACGGENRWHVQMPQLLTYAKMQQRSRHISTFARQSDQDDRLLGCPLRAFATLPTGDAATMTTMALVPAQQVVLSAGTSQRIGSIGSQVPRDAVKNWRYGPGGCLGHGHFIVQRCASTMWHRVSTMWLTSSYLSHYAC